MVLDNGHARAVTPFGGGFYFARVLFVRLAVSQCVSRRYILKEPLTCDGAAKRFVGV